MRKRRNGRLGSLPPRDAWTKSCGAKRGGKTCYLPVGHYNGSHVAKDGTRWPQEKANPQSLDGGVKLLREARDIAYGKRKTAPIAFRAGVFSPEELKRFGKDFGAREIVAWVFSASAMDDRAALLKEVSRLGIQGSLPDRLRSNPGGRMAKKKTKRPAAKKRGAASCAKAKKIAAKAKALHDELHKSNPLTPRDLRKLQHVRKAHLAMAQTNYKVAKERARTGDKSGAKRAEQDAHYEEGLADGIERATQEVRHTATKRNPLTKAESSAIMRRALALARSARTAYMSDRARAAAYGFAAGMASAVASSARRIKGAPANKQRYVKAAHTAKRLMDRAHKNPRGRVLSGKTYRPKFKLSKAARSFLRKKIVLLMREGRKQKQAVAVAFAMARKAGFKVPAVKNPLLGVMTMLGKLPLSALASGTNPGKVKRKAAKKTKTGKRKKSRKASNPSARSIRYRDMTAKQQRKYRKQAVAAARFAGASLDDVVFDYVSTPKGYAKDHAFVEVGEEVRTQYRVRGSRSKRHGYLWDHKAGDNGKGAKKTRPALIAIDLKTKQRVLVSRPGSRPGFSVDRGLLG